MTGLILFLTLLLAALPATAAGLSTVKLTVGAARRLDLPVAGGDTHFESSAPEIAEVFQNGFVVGLKPGEAKVTVAGAKDSPSCTVTVTGNDQLLVDPATLKQFPDNHLFTVNGRKCFGSELNGQRAFRPDERKFTHANRIINPQPLRRDRPLDWELAPRSQVFDGAGVFMGIVPSTLKARDRTVPASMFNFGASKVIFGRICAYAFSVTIEPSDAVLPFLDAARRKEGRVSTSAWIPLDDIVDKERFLERAGLGENRLPALPLALEGLRVTGGRPDLYMTSRGELQIVQRAMQGVPPPVPSHYLRRPSGTVNLVYSVPGFGLGGEGTDSFLVSDGLLFYPAPGAREFKQPTYFPLNDPNSGKVAPQTMTFLYGAVKTASSEPVYGWIAREALAQ